jgi:hypothetical protein
VLLELEEVELDEEELEWEDVDVAAAVVALFAVLAAWRGSRTGACRTLADASVKVSTERVRRRVKNILTVV